VPEIDADLHHESIHHSSRIAERTSFIAKQRWGNSRLQDEDLSGSDDSADESALADDVDDDNLNDADNGGLNDADDDGLNDEDDDDSSRCSESDVAGIPAWDMLGEGFEREVSSKGSLGFIEHLLSSC
jgi:hypothetical protein